MVKRFGVLVAALAASAGLVLSAAPSASATGGFYVRSHHSSYAECDAAGKAGAHLWGQIYFCKPFAAKPSVYELWVR
ncbi:hypothetical protein ACH4E8_12070 [Streptomyces sp. NPDC017979]|uniref:hypothetical protein n=1 Tax=Streptomyces sp. NPDC017979 TaxID=3365024 RepID=UPI00379DEE1C